MNIKQITFRIIFALVAASLVSLLKLDYIESYLYDVRVRTKSFLGLAHPQDTPIVLIKIDSMTVERFKGFPSFNDHTEFLNKLIPADPRFVIYDFRSKDGEIRDIEGDQKQKERFAFVTKQVQHFYVTTDDLEMKGEEGKLKLLTPLDQIRLYPGPKCPDTVLLAKDGVHRRMMLSYQNQKMLHPFVAAFYNPKIQNLEAVNGRFDFYDSDQLYINYNRKDSFPTIRFEDVIDGKVDPVLFKGKVVIVGTDTGKSAKEYVLTPFSREVNGMTSIELHANSLQTLIENSAPIRLNRWFGVLLTCLISVLTVYVVLSLKPSRGLIILGLTLVGIIVFAILLFVTFKIWLDIAHALLAIFLCYYFFIPYRLIIENRKSWEYYQKNKLLQQVEELKTNFISMMSHDLKTPIARIQGMTEVILKDQVLLSSTQREAVDTIKGSSDDLLKFINSILQYGRIESQGVELHKQAKDVNQLLNEVIKKHEFLARVKRIKIQTELDPLFPVQVDPDLMKQVFSNLLENAIKYSHEDSLVVVKSREEGDKIIVDFIDQGLGIPTVDLPNIFMKFFRSHNVKTSTIKGTGLGLYLAQYFIRLHKGDIMVASEAQKGSQFTVLLPLQN